MKEKIIFNADLIRQIIEDTEYIQRSGESEYTKKQAKITAYNEIVELLNGDKE